MDKLLQLMVPIIDYNLFSYTLIKSRPKNEQLRNFPIINEWVGLVDSCGVPLAHNSTTLVFNVKREYYHYLTLRCQGMNANLEHNRETTQEKYLHKFNEIMASHLPLAIPIEPFNPECGAGDLPLSSKYVKVIFRFLYFYTFSIF